MSDPSAVNDDLPRPYAEEPPVVVPPTGLRLVRAHPWSVAATALLTGLILALYPMVLNALLNSSTFNQNPAFFLLLPAFALVAVLPTVVPLTVVAVLAKRRVTMGRALGLVAASAIVVAAQGILSSVVRLEADAGGEMPMRVLSIGLNLMTLFLVGLLGLVIYPPLVGRNNVPALVLGSVVMALIVAAENWIAGTENDPGVLSWTVGAFTGVGWAVAVLFISPPAVPETSRLLPD